MHKGGVRVAIITFSDRAQIQMGGFRYDFEQLFSEMQHLIQSYRSKKPGGFTLIHTAFRLARTELLASRKYNFRNLDVPLLIITLTDGQTMPVDAGAGCQPAILWPWIGGLAPFGAARRHGPYARGSRLAMPAASPLPPFPTHASAANRAGSRSNFVSERQHGPAR